MDFITQLYHAKLREKERFWLELCDVLQDGTQKSQKVFVNIPTEVGATEAEEVGKAFSELQANTGLISLSMLTQAKSPR